MNSLRRGHSLSPSLCGSTPALAQGRGGRGGRGGSGPVTVLRPARVFDGEAMHEGWAVAVRGERIEAAGPAAGIDTTAPR